ncbi:hypothetical protein [Paraclostridium bifermentans]|uniref:hypothetical protein n=1 Tax=Paraclostridium bifermentans TaxID=1490 RepID=UPI00359C84C5
MISEKEYKEEKEELRKRYREEQFYRQSIILINDFSNEVLGGEIDRLKTYCFENLKGDFKYSYPNIEQIHNWRFDCDDTKLARAIYCVIWGYIFGLKADNIGPPYSKKTKQHYRGDTINSFQTLFGSYEKEIFAYRARFYDLDKDIKTWSNIIKFRYQYHTIGNFILLQNNKSDRLRINNGRGKCKLKDYFDLFLLDVYEYQKGNACILKKQLEQNSFYKEFSINSIREIFFLDIYFNDKEPKEFINISKDKRLKETGSKEYRKKNENKCFSEKEYKKLVNDYIEKSEEVIAKRSCKMVEMLKEEIKEAKKIGIL